MKENGREAERTSRLLLFKGETLRVRERKWDKRERKKKKNISMRKRKTGEN